MKDMGEETARSLRYLRTFVSETDTGDSSPVGGEESDPEGFCPRENDLENLSVHWTVGGPWRLRLVSLTGWRSSSGNDVTRDLSWGSGVDPG